MQILTSPESLSQRDIVGVLAETLGRPIPVDELTREQALARRAPWMPEPILAALLDAAAAGVGVPAPLTNGVHRITGHAPRTFADWAGETRADFAPA